MALHPYYRSSKKYMDRVQIFFNGLVGTTILLFSGGFFYYANETTPGAPFITNSLFLTITAGILLVLIPLRMYFFRKSYHADLKKIKKDKQLTDRMVAYFFHSKRLWMSNFLISMIPVLFYLLSGWYIFTGIYGLALVIFTIERPAGPRIMRLLEMSEKEKELFYSNEDLF
jgi:hypothetical protein